MNFNYWIRVSLLTLGTFVVAMLGFTIGGSIASALGIGSLAVALGAVGSLFAIIAAVLVGDVIDTALSTS